MKCPNCDILLDEFIQNSYKTFKCPKCVFITFENKKIIREIVAVVSVDQNGYEGIMAMNTKEGAMAIVNSNYNYLKEIFELMKKNNKNSELKLKLKRFRLESEEE